METLPEMPAYQHETVPVYRCRQPRHEGSESICGFVFAMRSSPVSLRDPR